VDNHSPDPALHFSGVGVHSVPVKRVLAGGVSALLAAGCIRHDHELVVENCGAEAVVVEVQKTYGPWWNPRPDEDEEVSVVGFSCWVGRYTSQIEKIRLSVRRERDGEVLYTGVFREGDFDDFGNHIRIRVYP